MSLSKRSIEMLLDLVEIKISSMDVADREDARHLQMLERCRAELKAVDSGQAAAAMATFASPARRPGPPPPALSPPPRHPAPAIPVIARHRRFGADAAPGPEPRPGQNRSTRSFFSVAS